MASLHTSMLLAPIYYLHTLICTLSATSVKTLGSTDTITCNRMGCECHVLGDVQYRVLVALVTVAALAAVVLTFGPQTPQSPLMAELTPSQQVETVAAGQVCIECGRPVASLYTEYGVGHIRLTQCENCKSFADKYVEHDVVIVFIDMLLHKPQVYRHLLVNKLEFRQPKMERNVSKLCILLVLFSVYIDWFRLEEGGRMRRQSELLFGQQLSFAAQYLFILVLSAIDAVALLAGVLLASIVQQRSSRQTKRWATMATALTISSFGKVLMIMLVIWEYNEPYYPWLLDTLIFTSYSTAMSVLFDINSLWASLMVVFGMATKQLFHLAALVASSALLS
ncbi:sterol homeostasis protein [Coemansia sp. RSA 1813]|nr:sterol homeostasis protein [Coemansia sp. RSA 1646]KAJ1773520.1 sterol homeostasis protein [Coemansia sp. RSA 1843]KAJ2090527.1 sterol homeostasis protein [Coemansia sp. RSA 986]KAJ2216385.1 sterol homeostasis protein [Coemansia sp. RSA 487]KAJ2570829.1 sterol homeostasis protein [Coemansia sp. RSA 1813]